MSALCLILRDFPDPAFSGVHHGPLQAGEWITLSDSKGRRHSVFLERGKIFHTTKGGIEHDELIDGPDAVVIRSKGGVEYLALRPLMADYSVSMPRGAAVIYPKDTAQIVTMADIFPGAKVVEAGAGSGALTTALLRAVGIHGQVISFERREDFAAVARKNVTGFFGGEHPAWRLEVGDLVEKLDETDVDRVVLDMLAPWECVDAVAGALVPGRRVLRVRRHHDPAEPVRRDVAGARRVHRAARLGVAGARLACRGTGGPAGSPDAGSHRVPGHRPADGARRTGTAEEAPAGTGRVRRRLFRAPQVAVTASEDVPESNRFIRNRHVMGFSLPGEVFWVRSIGSSPTW